MVEPDSNEDEESMRKKLEQVSEGDKLKFTTESDEEYTVSVLEVRDTVVGTEINTESEEPDKGWSLYTSKSGIRSEVYVVDEDDNQHNLSSIQL